MSPLLLKLKMSEAFISVISERSTLLAALPRSKRKRNAFGFRQTALHSSKRNSSARHVKLFEKYCYESGLLLLKVKRCKASSNRRRTHCLTSEIVSKILLRNWYFIVASERNEHICYRSILFLKRLYKKKKKNRCSSINELVPKIC